MTLERPSLAENEFRVGDVSRGAALRVGPFVVFNVEGRLCATQADCPHQGGPLAEGGLEGSVVTCPWHGSQFDVCTGALLRGPATAPLATFAVTVEGDVGRVELPPEPAVP